MSQRTVIAAIIAACTIGIVIGVAVAPSRAPNNEVAFPRYETYQVTDSDRQQFHQRIEKINNCDKAFRAPPPETLHDWESISQAVHDACN